MAVNAMKQQQRQLILCCKVCISRHIQVQSSWQTLVVAASWKCCCVRLKDQMGLSAVCSNCTAAQLGRHYVVALNAA